MAAVATWATWIEAVERRVLMASAAAAGAGFNGADYFWAMRAGATWTYQTVDGGEAGTWKMTIAPRQVKVAGRPTWLATSASGQTNYSASAGAAYIHRDQWTEDNGTTSFEQYTTPEVQMPAGMRVGQTLKYTTAWSGRNGSGQQWTGTAQRTVTLVKTAERVAAPAGTFSTVRVKVTEREEKFSTDRHWHRVVQRTQTVWCAKGIGVVKMSETSTGQSWWDGQPMRPAEKSTSSALLTAYSVPKK